MNTCPPDRETVNGRNRERPRNFSSVPLIPKVGTAFHVVSRQVERYAHSSVFKSSNKGKYQPETASFQAGRQLFPGSPDRRPVKALKRHDRTFMKFHLKRPDLSANMRRDILFHCRQTRKSNPGHDRISHVENTSAGNIPGISLPGDLVLHRLRRRRHGCTGRRKHVQRRVPERPFRWNGRFYLAGRQPV